MEKGQELRNPVLLVGPGAQLICGTQDTRTGTLKVGPDTRDPGPNSEVGPGTGDPRPETRDRESGFSATFLSSLWNLAFMNGFIFALCVYIYFVYLSLLYHKEYTLLIFYHLNELLFYSFFPCSCYEIFKFPTKPLIIAPYIEQWKRFKLMEIKKLSHNKESDPQRRL